MEQEILKTRRVETTYANQLPSDSPTLTDDHFYYLGLTVHKGSDRLSLRAKPIQLKSKLKGHVDITLRNVAEFSNFLKLQKFTRSHLAALCNGVYCPQGNLDAVYSNIARLIQRHIISEAGAVMSWSTKIDSKHFPILEKLATLYFKVQHLTMPRFCLLLEPLHNVEFYLVAFSDGSVNFSAACVYVITLHKFNDTCKVQLVESSSKL